MNFLRKHWYDLGIVFAIIALIILGIYHFLLTDYELLMWLSFASLLFHQFEEYRFPGTFPGMINKIMFKSKKPDRYPLNANTSFIINVLIGWTIYLLAAIGGEKFIWLGIGAILVSFGNVVAHTFLFNIRGKTIYNAGMATSLIFFLPCVIFFFWIISAGNLVTPIDYLIGVLLGVALNIFGIFKMITWLADKKTKYIFEKRNLLLIDRKK